MKHLLSIIIFLACCSFSSLGQGFNVARLDSFLTVLASKDMATGSLAISRNGNIAYQRAIGFSSILNDNKISPDANTKYRIGSATKMFTAVMIFQLVEEGKLKLDQKINTFFPDLPNAGKITLSDMLYHRSGLHDYTKDTDFFSWMDKPTSRDELFKIIKAKGSDFDPGTKADYSNTNYLLLGYVVENICKMSYADALTKRITSKIGLKNTYVGRTINVNDNESASYKYGGGHWSMEKETNLMIHGGAGAIVSTPTDMVRFINALFSGKLVGKASLVKMKTMVDDYGMGLFSNKYGSRTSFGHNGRVEEFYSAVWHFPEEQLSFAYITNGINYPRTDLIEGLLKICFNEQFEIPFIGGSSVVSGDFNKYVGKYSSGEILVECRVEDGKLFLETRGKPFTAEKIGENYFMNAESGYFFEFFPGADALEIKETDNIYSLKKIR